MNFHEGFSKSFQASNFMKIRSAGGPEVHEGGRTDKDLMNLIFTFLAISPKRLKIVRSAHTVYLRVLCGSQNKQRLFPYTALTDWFFITDSVYCAVRTGYLCVWCGSQNKQRLFPYTALTDWFL
jgi:hypothetical protein